MSQTIALETIQRADSDKLMHLIMGASDVKVEFPEGAKLTDMESTLAVAIKGYQTLQGAAEKLKPIIGRILLTVKMRKAWKGPYKNFTDFYTRKVVGELGFPRASALEALKIATAFPALSADEYARYGGMRLLLAARVTDATKPGHAEILKQSLTQSVDDFRNTVVRIGAEQVRSPRARPFVVSVRVDGDMFERWKAIAGETEDKAAVFGELLTAYESTHKGKVTVTPGKPARGPRKARTGRPSTTELESAIA